jgi:hypothetical protein
MLKIGHPFLLLLAQTVKRTPLSVNLSSAEIVLFFAEGTPHGISIPLQHEI